MNLKLECGRVNKQMFTTNFAVVLLLFFNLFKSVKYTIAQIYLQFNI